MPVSPGPVTHRRRAAAAPAGPWHEDSDHDCHGYGYHVMMTRRVTVMIAMARTATQAGIMMSDDGSATGEPRSDSPGEDHPTQVYQAR